MCIELAHMIFDSLDISYWIMLIACEHPLTILFFRGLYHSLLKISFHCISLPVPPCTTSTMPEWWGLGAFATSILLKKIHVDSMCSIRNSFCVLYQMKLKPLHTTL